MRALHRFAGTVLCLLVLIAGLPRAMAGDEILALTGATIYTSPEAAPIQDGVVLMQAGRITAVGSKVTVPPGARTIDLHPFH